MKTDQEMRRADPPRILDNTMRTTGDSCWRKMYWFMRGLEFASTPSYFVWGRAWHKGLETWYSTPGGVKERYEAAVKAAESLWDDEGCQDQGTNKRESLGKLLKAYVVSYTDEEKWKPVLLNGKMELGFAYPFRNTKYMLAGAVDGEISWQPHGELVLENKSSGVPLTDAWCGQWAFSTQITQYFWGLGQFLGHEPFGVLVNGVYKGVSQKAIAEFEQTGMPPEGAFVRHLEKRSEFQLWEFEEGIVLFLEALETEWTRWKWPKTSNHIECVGGIGKSPCAFRRLCLLDALPWEIEDPTGSDLKWRSEEWEPWKRGEGD
jgi:hypothetical protein